MKLLPDPDQSRPLALGLLAVAVILVYFVFFHWAVVRHFALSNEIGDLERQIARFKGIVEQADPMRERLDQLRSSQMDSALFLEGDDASFATAELIRMLREWVDRSAADSELCSITNTQPRRVSEPERFRSVHVNVRMKCPLDDFTRMLHAMESGVPLVFVDNMLINQPRTPDQQGRRGSSPYGELDIRFDMYGYINQPGAENDT